MALCVDTLAEELLDVVHAAAHEGCGAYTALDARDAGVSSTRGAGGLACGSTGAPRPGAAGSARLGTAVKAVGRHWAQLARVVDAVSEVRPRAAADLGSCWVAVL